MTDEQYATPQDVPEEIAVGEPRPLYGVGPFTLREVVLVGVWVVAFVVSFFAVTDPRLGVAGIPGGGLSVWTSGLDWILTIGVPTVAVFLIVLRRLSPTGIRRVGSLAIDQFASVAFSVATAVWLTTLWATVATAIATGFWLHTWVVWVSFFLMLAGVVLTVAAPFIPPFSEDFTGRPEEPAHRNARAVRAVVPRPPRPRPEPVTAPIDPYAQPSGGAQDYPVPDYGTAYVAPAYAPDAVGAAPASVGGYDAPAPVIEPDAAAAEQAAPASEQVSPASDTNPYAALGFSDAAAPAAAGAEVAESAAEGADAWAPQYARGREGGYRRGSAPATAETAQVAEQSAAPVAAAEPEPLATVEPQHARTSHQAFWVLAPEERDVHDVLGNPIFRIGPTAWALVIEDRGAVLVIRHEDERIGYLHDTSGLTRG